jgi:ADP-heptose:LPS heptosyltransferase
MLAVIHIRSGDIVYGKHRFNGRFARSKTISVPIAIRFLKELKQKGYEVICFGAKQEELEYLAKNLIYLRPII